MYLKFTERSMNIYMPNSRRQKVKSRAIFSNQDAEEEIIMSNPWVHVNDAAETVLFNGEKVSKVCEIVNGYHGCTQRHLAEVEEWINTHHPNNDINWAATKHYIEYINAWMR